MNPQEGTTLGPMGREESRLAYKFIGILIRLLHKDSGPPHWLKKESGPAISSVCYLAMQVH